MERKPGCTFCDPTKSERPHFARYGRDRIDLFPVLKTANLLVVPDALPVNDDGLHFLMVPIPHHTAYAQLPDFQTEVGQTLYQLEQKLGEEYVFFEHGGGHKNNGYTESKNQSVYHQHAHLVPKRGDIIRYIMDVLKQGENIPFQLVDAVDQSPIFQLKQLYQGHPYLYVQAGRLGIWAEDVGDNMPSQITQRNMSRYFGQEVNWKEIPTNDEIARLSVQRIANVIELCRNR